MAKKNPKKFSAPLSSESDIADDSDSDAITSFESVASEGHPQGYGHPPARRSKASTASVNPSPRQSPRKNVGKPSTSKAVESLRRELQESDSDVITSFESIASEGHPQGYGHPPARRSQARTESVNPSPRKSPRKNVGKPSTSKEVESPRGKLRGSDSEARDKPPKTKRPGGSPRKERPKTHTPQRSRTSESAEHGRDGSDSEWESEDEAESAREKTVVSKKKTLSSSKKGKGRAGPSTADTRRMSPVPEDDEDIPDSQTIRSGQPDPSSPGTSQARVASPKAPRQGKDRPGPSKGLAQRMPIVNNSDSNNLPRSPVRSGPSTASTSQNRAPRRAPATWTRNRKKAGSKALIEIKKYQKSTKLLIAKLPFSRLVKEIADSFHYGMRWQVLAIEALQEAAEMHLVHLFEDALLCTIHRCRVTLQVRDMQLAQRLGNRNHPL